jgi:hypothetical protein
VRGTKIKTVKNKMQEKEERISDKKALTQTGRENEQMLTPVARDE